MWTDTPLNIPVPSERSLRWQMGDLQVFESGAILMFLADKYGGLDTPEKRAEVNKWIVWANASLDPICFKARSALSINKNSKDLF